MNSYLKVLSERLGRVESEVASIRRELIEFNRSRPGHQAGTQKDLRLFRADKGIHRSMMKDLFAELCIEGQPIEPEELQERMERADLTTNELSRDLIKAREE